MVSVQSPHVESMAFHWHTPPVVPFSPVRLGLYPPTGTLLRLGTLTTAAAVAAVAAVVVVVVAAEESTAVRTTRWT